MIVWKPIILQVWKISADSQMLIRNSRELICKSLEYIFQASLNNESFPSEWKNANAVPIHIKK